MFHGDAGFFSSSAANAHLFLYQFSAMLPVENAWQPIYVQMSISAALAHAYKANMAANQKGEEMKR